MPVSCQSTLFVHRSLNWEFTYTPWRLSPLNIRAKVWWFWNKTTVTVARLHFQGSVWKQNHFGWKNAIWHIILQSKIKKPNKQKKHFCYKKGRFSYRLLFQKYNKKNTKSTTWSVNGKWINCPYSCTLTYDPFHHCRRELVIKWQNNSYEVCMKYAK